MKIDLSFTVIIITFIILALMMLIIKALYVEQETFDVGMPTLEYAKGVWIRPPKHTYISRFSQLQLNTGLMTVSFWIKIDKTTPYWRNVFRIGESSNLEWNPSGNAANLPYDWQQDVYRRPAIFITPNALGLHICHGTASDWNNPFNVTIPATCMVTMVWSTRMEPTPENANIKKEKVKCVVYVNDTVVRNHLGSTEFVYNGRLLQPDSDALLYLADRFYGANDFALRDLRIFPTDLNSDQVGELHKSTMNVKATPWSCVPGIGVPVRMNNSGDTECMSVNNRDCLWSGDCYNTLTTPADSVKPLACGEMHKKEWGSTGYEDPGHWCSKVRSHFS